MSGYPEEGCGENCGGDDAENKHFIEVVYSFANYAVDSHHDSTYFPETYDRMKAEDRALLGMTKAELSQLKQTIVRAIHFNQQWLSSVVAPHAAMAADYEGMDINSPDVQAGIVRCPPHHEVADRNISKVRSTLRQMVRDWAVEGLQEREQAYGPLLEALQKYMPITKENLRPDNMPPNVCCPGSGVGRLPFDVARLGYSSQGNEFSYQMLFASNQVLNDASAPHQYTIFPYVLSTNARRMRFDHLKAVTFPDIVPAQVLQSRKPIVLEDGTEVKTGDFSMCAGEFVEIYDEQVGKYDAVLCSFFIDTAKNMFIYIRTFAKMLRPGGVWASLGTYTTKFNNLKLQQRTTIFPNQQI